MGIVALLYAYVIGGVTFIPLLIVAFIYLHPKKAENPDESDGTEVEPSYSNLKVAEIEESMNSGPDTYISGWIYVTQVYIESTENLSSSMQPVADSEEGKSAYASLYKIAKSSEEATPQNLNHDQNSFDSRSINDGESLKASSIQDEFKKPPPSPSKSIEPISVDEEKLKNIKTSQKKHRYYAVLRHGNLFLYKNEKKVDVRHVIVLQGQLVSIWPRNIPDGQLFTNRTCLCLMKRDYLRPRRLSEGTFGGPETDSKITTYDILKDSTLEPPRGSFFLYFDTNTKKEDWYFALIRATKNINSTAGTSQRSDSSIKTNIQYDTNGSRSPVDPNVEAQTLHFKTSNMIDLIQTLHSSEGQFQTRWLNAMIGRAFLALQQTELLQDYLRSKIEKKLIKINKPGFLDDFTIVKVDVGNSAPYFTYPALKEISPDGTLVTSTNVHYHGKLTTQIATKLNINLGVGRYTRGEVDVLLSIEVTKLEGRILIKFKPAPSERIWYSFETEPDIQLKIEPIVSSRQLTYSIITSTIEKKFKEAIKESLVLPNWDDIVFYDTSDEIYRGGIWDKTVRNKPSSKSFDDTHLSISTETVPRKLETVPFEGSKLKLTSTFSELSSRLKRNKTSTTSINVSNTLSDGSLVGKRNVINMTNDEGSDSETNKKLGMNTLKKIGKWYFKDNKQETNTEAPLGEIDYKPPEMISSRRARRDSASSDTSEVERPANDKVISRKKSYDMFSKELGKAPPPLNFKNEFGDTTLSPGYHNFDRSGRLGSFSSADMLNLDSPIHDLYTDWDRQPRTPRKPPPSHTDDHPPPSI